ELDGVNDLLPQIEAVGFGHSTGRKMSLPITYVLNHMAVAIPAAATAAIAGALAAGMPIPSLGF
ncbi:MAG: hypothetical protein KME47_06230, partial [Nodosilinea sp. WJT8-NPBG4]|nr:hypothetical protein [Nodosilinea sp. WJT8-NPBG4]